LKPRGADVSATFGDVQPALHRRAEVQRLGSPGRRENIRDKPRIAYVRGGGGNAAEHRSD
jgi:hypothetical protein